MNKILFSPTKQRAMKEDNQPAFEKMVLVIKKDVCNDIGYDFALSFYDWCKKNKIKVEEPLNKSTQTYDRFIISLDTFQKLFAFSNKYLKVLKLKPDALFHQLNKEQ